MKVKISDIIVLDNWVFTKPMRSDHKYIEEQSELKVFGRMDKDSPFKFAEVAVAKVDRRFLRGKDGRVYQLGVIDPKFKYVLKRVKPDWDWKNPLAGIPLKLDEAA